MSLKLAIVGRPNVGKSTLFNRLVGKRLALVDDTPGVTRDRRSADGSIGDLHFQVIDTAGLEEAADDSLEARMRAQTDMAILEADVILFMIDAKAGVTPADSAFANMLRKSEKPVILLANKVEGKAGEPGYYDAFGIGFGEPVPISAEHGLGMADIYEAIVFAVGGDIALPADEIGKTSKRSRKRSSSREKKQTDILDGDIDDGAVEYDPSRPLKIAIVGRPNAGKSTLINQLIGEERLLTGPEAGITRDSISIDWRWKDRTIRLFDTAGMRKKARVQEKLEKLSVADGLRAIQYAEVVIIVIDALMPFEKQDLQIADLVIREGRAPVIVLNKWDMVEDRQSVLDDLHEKAERLLPQIKGLKVVPISGLTGEGSNRLMQAVLEVHEIWNSRIPTAKLNRWLDGIIYHHPPPAVAGRRIKIKYITQIKSRPPTFVASCSRPDALPASYSRYMVNDLRESFDLWATPIRLHFRKGENPYASKARKR
ncbi:MAG: ribosome biogenesis GTPase Der [Rhizobiaceae bacterium]